jgi:hypothetical protein
VIDSDVLDAFTVAVGLATSEGDFVSGVPIDFSLTEKSPSVSFFWRAFPVVSAVDCETELWAVTLVLTEFSPTANVPSVCDPTSPITEYYDG